MAEIDGARTTPAPFCEKFKVQCSCHIFCSKIYFKNCIFPRAEKNRTPIGHFSQYITGAFYAYCAHTRCHGHFCRYDVSLQEGCFVAAEIGGARIRSTPICEKN
jgi:hypothetical protein